MDRWIGGTGMKNGLPSSQTRQPNTQPRTQLDERRVQRQLLLQSVGDQDGDDEPVDTDDTGHDDGDNVCPATH